MKTISAPLKQWLFNDAGLYSAIGEEEQEGIDGLRLAVFIAIHLGALGIFFTGFSWPALLLFLLLYLSRMFFVTAFYHRYFSHKTYRVSRTMRLLMAVAGCTAGQRGPLWWASHHRDHHVNSDTPRDPHSPRHGMLNSHTLWFLKRGNFPMKKGKVKDLLKYPELVALERIDWLPFVMLAVLCYLLGEALALVNPQLGTSGLQFLVWGFFLSTIALYHATYTINSLCHRYGRRRFNTNDDSRNNFLLALLTLGEGWHNNHHRYPVSTRQGFYWWEIDLSYLVLCLMSQLGLVSGMRPVPAQVLREAYVEKTS